MKIITTREYNLEMQSANESHINKVENMLLKYNSGLWQGFTYVEDKIYETCIRYLELLHPTSPILESNKNIIILNDLTDETSSLLDGYITDEQDSMAFMLNLQGLNIRAFYELGELKRVETFGRSLGEVDVTDKVMGILGDRNDFLDTLDEVILEGVLSLPFSELEYVGEYVSSANPYSGVFAIVMNEIRECYDALHFTCTDIEVQGEDISFLSLTERLKYAETLGLEVAEILELEIEGNILNTIDNAIYIFDVEFTDYDYLTDGVRVIVDEGTIILAKVGKWSRGTSKGVVKEIRWQDSKEKKVPILILEEGIYLTSEMYVEEIPLKSVNLLLILDISVGNIINFESLGDLGVVILTNEGEIIKKI